MYLDKSLFSSYCGRPGNEPIQILQYVHLPNILHLLEHHFLLHASTVSPSPHAMHTHFDICFHRRPHCPPRCSVPPPHWRRARYRGAALHLDDGAAFLPLQQISGSGDLSISESMIGCNQDTCQVAKLNAYPGGKIRSRSWPRWPGRRTPRRQWPGSWPEWLPGCWIPDRKSRCSRSAVRGR